MIVESNLLLTEKEIIRLGTSIEEIQKNLSLPNPEYQNMIRFGKGRFYKKVEPYLCYLKKVGETYVVPRFYFSDKKESDFSGISDFKVQTNKGRTTDYKNTITLRNYQDEFYNLHKDTLIHSAGILLEAACGSGKTIMGIYLASLWKKQTLVVVPTYYLAKQWKKRISDTTDASVQILTSDIKEINVESDFTIVVMDLFTVRVLPDVLIKNIGCVILDEAHRLGAETYLPILNEIPAHRRLALTATFRRMDGVHRILKYHFGEYLMMESRFPKPFIYGIRTGVTIKGCLSKNRPYQKMVAFMESHEIPFTETKGTVCFTPNFLPQIEQAFTDKLINKTTHRELFSAHNKASELSYTVMESYLNENSKRRKLEIALIRECLEKGRTILFLSKRKDILKSYAKLFSEYKPMLIISETKERTEEEEKYLQDECRLVLGVTQLAKEGLDIDRLDTLFIHLPIKDTEQAIGRISRLHPAKKQPIAFYFLDDCAYAYAIFNNAQKNYFKINGDFKDVRTLQTIKTVI